jgi:Tol biopolymer transport system component
VRIELGPRAHFPSVAPSRGRLAFFRPSGDADIHRLHIGGASTALIRSTFMEMHPQLSPDGSRIAFSSNRAGVSEIWLAEADGANPTRLTRGPGVHQGSPSWSPDGRSIVFDSQDARGQVDIWAIGSDGTGLRQITRDPMEDNVPSFSRDGRFIYLGSNRTGRNEVWRVAAGGGQEEQLTHEGGGYPQESHDGRTRPDDDRELPLEAFSAAVPPPRTVRCWTSTSTHRPGRSRACSGRAAALTWCPCRLWPSAS